MTKPRENPIESFDSTMFRLFLKGGTETVRLPFNSYGKAVRFRQRLHALRRVMRNQQHEHYKLVERCRISILWGTKANLEPVEELISGKNVHWPKYPDKTPCIVQLQPRDLEFKSEMDEFAHLVEDIPIPSEKDLQNPKGASAIDDLLLEMMAREDTKKPTS